MDEPKKNHQYSFERLHVWSDIREMTKHMYSITTRFPQDKKFGLMNQMRRFAISVASNLAEAYPQHFKHLK